MYKAILELNLLVASLEVGIFTKFVGIYWNGCGDRLEPNSTYNGRSMIFHQEMFIRTNAAFN